VSETIFVLELAFDHDEIIAAAIWRLGEMLL
jgi:hypothetical protein